MKLIRHQITLFFSEAFFGNLQGILKFFIDEAGSVLDAQPIILPLPDDAPEEVPRIILRSADHSQELAVKANRVDAAVAKPLEDGISASERIEFEKQCIAWLLPLLDNRGFAVNRVGVVMQRAHQPEGSSPGEFISKKYCRDEYLEQPFRNAKNFEIHCLKNYSLFGKMVNSWVRIQTVNVLPSRKQVVGVLNDLNHVPTRTRLEPEDVRSFVQAANSEMEKILSYYKLEEC